MSAAVDRPAPPKTRRHKDPTIAAELDENRAFLRRLLASDMVWGRAVQVSFPDPLIPDQPPTLVVHGLSRRPTGYIVVRSSVPMTVYSAVPPAGADLARQIYLHSTAKTPDNETTTLWVF